jgi:uncharacterized membrane protein YbhN (UPF0104 family)
VAFSWSLFNWIADVACLAFAAYAAGGKPSLAGLTVAYAAARAVGSIPLMPGGLLVVEAVLGPGLVSSGMTLAAAISAMLIYRLVSWFSSRRSAGWCSSSCYAPRPTSTRTQDSTRSTSLKAVGDAEPKHDS